MGSLREVGPGCWAWLRLPGDWDQANIGLVVGEGASLLVDTPWDLHRTLRMLGALGRAVARAPVRLVVNTNADPGHWWGNAAMLWAEIVASAGTADAMRRAPTPDQLSVLRGLAAVTTAIPGRAGRLGRYVHAGLAPIDIDAVTLRFPDRTFEGGCHEHVGGRDVEVIEFGGAHRTSDSVVLVPDARVVYAGDLLVTRVTPAVWHGRVSNWLRALDVLTALDADVFVPGHGPVSTRRELCRLRSYWTWLASSVTAADLAGHGTLETAVRLSRTPEFRAFASWEHPERLYVNVHALRREHRGLGPMGSTPIAMLRAYEGMARFAHESRPRA